MENSEENQQIIPQSSSTTQIYSSSTTQNTKSSFKKFLLILPLVLLIILFLIVNVFFMFSSSSSKEKQKTPLSSARNNTLSPVPSNSVSTEQLYKKGYYLNKTFHFSLSYPTEWIVGEKTIDRHGNLSLSFYLFDPKTVKWYEAGYFIISIQRQNDDKFQQLLTMMRKSRKEETIEDKTYGQLNGKLYSGTSDQGEGIKDYEMDFIANKNDVNYYIQFKVPYAKKDQYLLQAQKVFESINSDDSLADVIPNYFFDNFVLDPHIARPSLVPNPYSLLYEEARGDTAITWLHARNVTETGNGHNDYNVHVHKLNSQSTLPYLGDNIITLENVVKEKSMLAKPEEFQSGKYIKEPITVKGYQGYFINYPSVVDDFSYEQQSRLQRSSSFGYLIFVTDKVLVDIEGGDSANFSKEDFIKIAESMIH